MNKKIVAVTACITGIAHTFMSAANLKKSAEKIGYSIKVETQSSMGSENKLTDSEIEEADVVILAIDTKIEGEDRFENKPKLVVGTSEVVANADKVINDAINLVKK
ncbi:PTS fructose transporter subunit IIB [Helcococcus kunzii]|uniref:PTS fructose transporter subunit IIB n=1 Tax=Helcococcus kunzii TaxID=40091 RepID=UPI0024AD6494|nr:PTS fructose transporter subunit IIB [Helcococcus kunzii]